MERIRKTFFDPLATSKARIREILEQLPLGSAHPFSPERLLLCRTENGIEDIDISSYAEHYFFNAVDLGEMGEVLLKRMAGFASLGMSFLLWRLQTLDPRAHAEHQQEYSMISKSYRRQRFGITHCLDQSG
jgi:hypothetical protein